MIKTNSLSVKFFLDRMHDHALPIPNLVIPNIIIPANLSNIKPRTEMKETISTYIRHLLNSITTENVHILKKQLLIDINEKVESDSSLNEIADELLQSFIISKYNIDNYMQILNTIYKAAFKKGEVLSNTIGNIFLDKLRQMIFTKIDEKHIFMLAQKDLEDEDEQDFYNKEREQIINLIIILCKLYDQRKTPLVKLNAMHIYAVMEKILNFHKKNYDMMIKLGNPVEGECDDEEQYEYLRKLCHLYAEQLYIFLFTNGDKFMQDNDKIKGNTLSDLVDRFKKEVLPVLSETYLQSRCKSLNL